MLIRKIIVITSLSIIISLIWAMSSVATPSPFVSTVPKPTLAPSPIPSSAPTPAIYLPTPPVRKTLSSDYHIYQTFNNCGPAALSMALSYYGISISQQTLGQSLRPYQHPRGDNDDKSVALSELAAKSTEYGLLAYLRPNGNVDLIKQFINQNIPIITRTLLNQSDDIGHFRIIKGFDDQSQIIIQDDSLQGKNLTYTYHDFNQLWQQFNYEYLVLIPPDKQLLAETTLGKNLDPHVAWTQAAQTSRTALSADPQNLSAGFNLSVALYHTGDYHGSVSEFEKVETRLPWRTLWYQIEPLLAYQALGNHARVLSLTEQILSRHNRAFSELYFLRGQVYLDQGQPELARSEFEKAVYYNINFKPVQTALADLNQSTPLQ